MVFTVANKNFNLYTFDMRNLKQYLYPIFIFILATPFIREHKRIVEKRLKEIFKKNNNKILIKLRREFQTVFCV
jgi:hypothetical protein